MITELWRETAEKSGHLGDGEGDGVYLREVGYEDLNWPRVVTSGWIYELNHQKGRREAGRTCCILCFARYVRLDRVRFAVSEV